MRKVRVALSGFPYQRRGIRDRFPAVLEETGWGQERADLRLLCMHHCVQGATVGPSDFTFRGARDVVRCSDLPEEFAAVLSGHIHRHQVLRTDLGGRPLSTPVLYPGSVERTAFAENGEEKGYLLLELESGEGSGRLVRTRFVPLPARPMLVRDLHPGPGAGGSWSLEDLMAELSRTLADAPGDAVLRVRVHGRVPKEAKTVLAASALRRTAPPEMNLEVLLLEDRAQRPARIPKRKKRAFPGMGRDSTDRTLDLFE